LDLVRQSQRLAATLGGRLEIPKLPWKYRWIQKLFGLSVAKRVRQRWNRCKSFVMRYWDKILFRLEGETHCPTEARALAAPRQLISPEAHCKRP
jgi:hypothetical protein